MQGTTKERQAHRRMDTPESERLRVYLLITLIIVVLALAALLSVSRVSSDANKCLGIILSRNRYSCLESLALSKENESICGYIPSPYSDSCYLPLAEKVLDPGLCSGIRNPDTYSLCIDYIANTTGRYTLCDRLEDPQQAQCLIPIALRSSNQSICGEISNKTDKTVCISSVNLASASSGNPTYCMLVTNSTDITITSRVISYSGIYNSNSSHGLGSFSQPLSYVPYLYGGTLSSRDLCYFYVVSKSENASYCSNLQNATLEGLCTYTVKPPTSLHINTTINYTKLLNGCFQSGAYQQTCITSVLISEAVNTKNSSICTKLASQISIYQCYATLARTYNDTRYCGLITNATANNACIQDMTYNVTTG